MPVSADKENKLGVHPNDHKSTATLDGGVGGRRDVPYPDYRYYDLQDMQCTEEKKYLFKIWYKIRELYFSYLLLSVEKKDLL